METQTKPIYESRYKSMKVDIHLIVIGKDTSCYETPDEFPIERALMSIASLFEKRIRLFISGSDGTAEFKHTDREICLESANTVDLANETFSTLQRESKIWKLLLFDTSSADICSPAAGLVAWLTAFRTPTDNNMIKLLNFFEVVSSFFIQESTGIFWTGLKSPDDFEPETLLQRQWKTQMDSLMHREQNVIQS